MSCSAWTGQPCTCKRITVKCLVCRRDTTISHGDKAPPINPENYTCFRCRR